MYTLRSLTNTAAQQHKHLVLVPKVNQSEARRVQAHPGCPPDWIHYRQSCYYLSKDMQSFDDAEAICMKKSGSLVAMEDMEEQ
ncbi:hypothetical protein CRUP_036079, partial [Coryphaenoides rupestris]